VIVIYTNQYGIDDANASISIGLHGCNSSSSVVSASMMA